MCGFVVTTEVSKIKLMTEAQRFRGPDDVSYWNDSHIAMGHVLLDINGEHQVQPYETKKGNHLVFNGEMYDSNIANDTKFLADGYETYGFKFIEFADWHGSFAYYKDDEITIARDHFGAKPLWYKLDDKEFTASTSLRSIFNKEVDMDKWKHFDRNPIWTGHLSPYKDLKKVAPGQVITYNIKTKKISQKNMWDYYSIKSEHMNIPELEEKLITSMRKVANNKQKTGIFLSGGLDSTFVLSVVKDMGLDLTAYICAYEDVEGEYHTHKGFMGEKDLAIKTCKKWNVPYKVVTLKKSEVDNFGNQWVNNTHTSWVDKNRQAPRYLMCKTASEDGCKVILTGDSADEFFTGYTHHAKRFTIGYDNDTIKFGLKQHKEWIPKRIWSETDTFNNGLFFDLLVTSEQNVLAADQTCGMFGMESRPVFLGQNFARYIFKQAGVQKFKPHIDYETGTYKYVLREALGHYLPDHIKERKTKVGWSSPWNNNHRKVQRHWKNEVLDKLQSFCMDSCTWLDHGVKIDTDGKYKFCCISKDNTQYNIADMTVEEYKNTSEVIQAKQDLLDKNYHEFCESCKIKEELGMISKRYLSTNAKGIEAIKLRKTWIDPGKGVTHFDLALGNACNLKCISCWPRSSSSIMKESIEHEGNKIHYLDITPEINNWITEENLNKILNHEVKRIEITGGEPMMVKHLVYLLKKLDSTVEIELTTNGTIWNPAVIKELKRFTNLSILVSLDVIGEKAKYVRTGSDWNVIENNIRKYRQFADVKINCLQSVLSAPYYTELKEWANKVNLQVLIVQCMEPPEMCITNFPDDYKHLITYWHGIPSTTADKKYVEVLRNKIKTLDKWRDMNIKDYIPEVAKAYGL